MRGDKESTKSVEVGSIVQINPESGDFANAGAFVQVTKKESWGVTAHSVHNGIQSITWNHIEPTGGTAVWGPDKKVFKAPAPTLKHHP